MDCGGARIWALTARVRTPLSNFERELLPPPSSFPLPPFRELLHFYFCVAPTKMSKLRRDRGMTLRDLTAAAILPDAKPEREATATVKERKRSLCPGVPASPLHPIPRKLEALSPSCPNRSSSEEKLSKGALGHSHAGPESESAKSLVRIPHNRNEWRRRDGHSKGTQQSLWLLPAQNESLFSASFVTSVCQPAAASKSK